MDEIPCGCGCEDDYPLQNKFFSMHNGIIVSEEDPDGIKKFKYLDRMDIDWFSNEEEDFDWYLRYKLGLRNFPQFSHTKEYNKDNLDHQNKKKNEHFRFDFDADNELDTGTFNYCRKINHVTNGIKNNQKIISLFDKFFDNKKVVIRTLKGELYYKVIPKYADIRTYDIKSFDSFDTNFGKGTIQCIKEILFTFSINYGIKYLRVPYREKNEVKKLGAKFDFKGCKEWYVPNGYDLVPFIKWIKT